MGAFAYRAADRAGRVHGGQLTASSRSAAIESLSARGLIPVEVSEADADGKRSARLTRRDVRPPASPRINSRELLSLTQSLAALLNAGLTVDRALHITYSLAPSAGLRDVTGRLLRSVRAGRSLSESVHQGTRGLPGYFVSMLSAGEAGGFLPQTCRRLEELLRREVEVRERIRGALIYPGLLAGVVFATLVLLLAFVLPRFELLFAESQAALPVSTRVVLASGRLIADYWMAGLGFVAAIIGAVRWQLRSGERSRFDRWAAHTRLTFGIPAMTNVARLFRTVGMLCANGQALPAALRVARGTLTNAYLSGALDTVIREVQSGRALSDALAVTQAFPPLAVRFARVGEESGRLDEMLLSAASVLEESSRVSLERLLTLFVPLLTILMGLIVAGLIGSVLIGLLSINDLAF